jgi:ElaB/YqjD/DUF883 family membrane-anchored ribosome-binding protein
MSQNRTTDGPDNIHDMGAGGAGSTRDAGAGMTTGGSATGGATAGAVADTEIAAKAREYGQMVADAASSAKDYVADKASVVGDKISDLRNVDYGQLAEDAKDYARQNPGQALLIAAAVGFIVGFLLRPPGDPTTPPPPPRKRR